MTTQFKIPRGIECQDWEPMPDKVDPRTGNCSSKLCRFYLAPDAVSKRGLCSLPARFSCQEWDRANPGLVPPIASPAAPAAQRPVEAPQRGQTSLQVYGVESAPAADTAAKKPSRDPRELPYAALAQQPGADVLVAITASQVEALRIAGLEVEVRSDEPAIATFWLVPQKTGKDRMELTFDEAATIRMIADAFPGARVVGLRKSQQLSSFADPLTSNSDDLAEE